MMRIGFDGKRAVQNFTGLGNYSRYVLEALQTYYPNEALALYAPKLVENKRLDPILKKGNIELRTPKTNGWKKLRSLWRIWGITTDLEKDNIVLPVTNINISYKNPAMLEDIVVVETSLEKYTPLYAVFKQQMFNKDTNKLLCEAFVTVVAVDKDGKLYRKLPNRMIELFEKATK